MVEEQQLSQSYQECEYRIRNHEDRDVEVLKKAFDAVPMDQPSDLYGAGEVIEQFQEKMAKILGKESAVFFPSGTMAQQVALRIWSDQAGNKKIAYHPLSHLEIHEEDGLRKLHQLEPVLLGAKERLVSLQDILATQEDISCLLLELPQREIGGQLPSFEELNEISNYCRDHHIRLHLDGARLWECQPFYQKTAAEICSLFDSVYVSFYKGLGGVAGAILAGPKNFTETSKIWKRRHGGDLISLYPYIVPADYYYEQRKNNMESYYNNAVILARQFNRCEQTKTLPEIPVTNMFHVHFDLAKKRMERILLEVHEKTKIGFTSALNEIDSQHCYFEISVGDGLSLISTTQLEQAFELLKQKLGEKG